MKDQNGLYYYPNPSDVTTRVYVRQGQAAPQFRLWKQDLPDVWEKHGWLDLQVIEAAAAMYRETGSGADPLLLYDTAVAKALIKQDAAG